MRPLGLHQDPEANSCPTETAGSVTNRLHRRHTDPGRVQGDGPGPYNSPDILTQSGEPGLCSKQSQVLQGSPEEKQWHINCLEALVAFHALKRDKKGVTVLLRLDNISAVSYVNKLGGTVSPRLNSIVRDLWLWCMNRDTALTAEHLPGILNTIADEESRAMKDRSDRYRRDGVH